MESKTTGTIPTPDSILRELAEQQERQGWAHHVADAATGELFTTELSRPVTPLSRLERLSRLGHQFDVPILGMWTHRLTPRHPYQASPRGTLSLFGAEWFTSDYYDDGIASYFLAALGERQQQGILEARLSDLPTSRCLVTLRFRTSKLDGHEVGSVGIRVHDGTNVSFRLAVHGSADGEHIFDFVWVPPAPQSGFTMVLDPQSGLFSLSLHSLTVTPDPVVHP